jgi:LysR family transcriptional regulator, glycine cleavage system transcriptional activator
MPDRLPPLTALRAFEAAARHMSFSKAAEELFVTPAALSYQIKQLEEHLGQPLFRRLNRAVELTEAGRALRPGVAEGFDCLRQAVRAVMRLGDDQGLAITAGPAFTAKWLAPRFFRFAEAHPEIELRFVASLRIMDFDRDGVDAAIRFGTGSDDGFYSEVLTDDWATPVCTPKLAARIAETGSLAGLTLLHDESIGFLDRPADWPAWGRVTGMAGDWTHGARFTNADHAIDVALEEGGVALGRITLVERYLDHGRLVAPFTTALRVGAQYRFVCPPGGETRPKVCAFLAWMREEIKSLERFREGMAIIDP